MTTINASKIVATNTHLVNFHGTISLSHVGTDADGKRVVIAVYTSRRCSYPTTATYGGTAMTLRDGHNTGNDNCDVIFTLDLAPGQLVGTQTCELTGGTNHNYDSYLTVTTFYSDGYESTGSGSNGSMTLTTADGKGAAAGGTCSAGTGTLAETGATVETDYESYATSYDIATGYALATGATTTISWTHGVTDMVGVAIKGFTVAGYPKVYVV